MPLPLDVCTTVLMRKTEDHLWKLILSLHQEGLGTSQPQWQAPLHADPHWKPRAHGTWIRMWAPVCQALSVKDKEDNFEELILSFCHVATGD